MFACTAADILASTARNTTVPQVALVVNGFGILNPSSGIATAYASLAEMLVATGYHVTVLYAVLPTPPAFEAAVVFYRNNNITLIS
jgi:hypothetical protein